MHIAIKIALPIFVFGIGLFIVIFIFKKTKSKIKAFEESIEKENTEVDEEFAALYRGYQTLNETDKSILKATLDAIVNAKKGDK
jgi:hypothetical protein